jgi:hypothetical protein
MQVVLNPTMRLAARQASGSRRQAAGGRQQASGVRRQGRGPKAVIPRERSDREILWVPSAVQGIPRASRTRLANRPTTIDGYDDLVIQIDNLAAKFRKPMVLIEGDSHVFRVDQPFTAASPSYTDSVGARSRHI